MLTTRCTATVTQNKESQIKPIASVLSVFIIISLCLIRFKSKSLKKKCNYYFEYFANFEN